MSESERMAFGKWVAAHAETEHWPAEEYAALQRPLLPHVPVSGDHGGTHWTLHGPGMLSFGYTKFSATSAGPCVPRECWG